MQPWYEGPLASFDTETTGVDVETDRIVSAALVVQDGPQAPPRMTRWLVDPGVPVPQQATEIHGLTEGFLHRYGTAPGPAIEQMARALAEHSAAAVPLVVMNAPFDLTLLDRELRRHRGKPLSGYLERAALCVLDPWVLDKYADRYRRGRRTLTDLCAQYAVTMTDAHDAAADAAAAMSVVREIGRRNADRLIGTASPAELHVRQALWHAAQARGLEAWFARKGAQEHCDPAWPIRPDLPAAA